MDEAALRRGAESANARWDNPVAILTGDFLFSRSSELTAHLGPEAVRIQAETFARLVEGQILRDRCGPGDGRGPARALPARRRRQDRLADRDLGPLRRAVRRCADEVEDGAHRVRRAASASPSSSPTTSSTSPATPTSPARPPAPTCARASRRCRCCWRRRSTDPADARLLELLDGRPHRRRPARRGARPAARAPRDGRGPGLRPRAGRRGARAARRCSPRAPVRDALDAFADLVATRTAWTGSARRHRQSHVPVGAAAGTWPTLVSGAGQRAR